MNGRFHSCFGGPHKPLTNFKSSRSNLLKILTHDVAWALTAYKFTVIMVHHGFGTYNVANCKLKRSALVTWEVHTKFPVGLC